MNHHSEALGPTGDQAHVQDPLGTSSGPGPEAWRAGIDADRRKRRRRPEDQRETLRRLTVTAAVAAVGLNALLFGQTGIGQVGPVAVESAIVSFIHVFVPGATLQPPSQAPSPGLGARPIVTTGGS